MRLPLGAVLSLLFLVSCTPPMEAHRFSNLVLNENALWFGAGYRLYRVDLESNTPTVVFDTKDVLVSFVRIEGNRVFFGGHHSPRGWGALIWSLDLSDSHIVWKLEIEDSAWQGRIVTPPLVAKETIVVATRKGLHGIDKSSGMMKWEITDNWFGGGELSPILIDGIILYSIEPVADDHAPHLLALADSSSGKTVRTISIPRSPELIPAVHGDCLFFADSVGVEIDPNGDPHYRGEHRLNCLDLESGKIVWSRKDYGVGTISQIDFYKGLVFESFRESLLALDEHTGAVRWQSKVGISRNPVFVEGADVIALQIAQGNGENIVFVDPITGQTRYGTVSSTLTSPVFAGHEMFYGSENALKRVDIVSGKELWSIPVDSLFYEFNDD